MNAIVLAGGRGSRLMPLTSDIPKPALPVCGYPILDYVTAQLCYYGVRKIVYAVGYLPDVIRKRAEKYACADCVTVAENKPLGTCGAVKNAEKLLGDCFFVLSGDCLSDINLFEMAAMHKQSGALATIAVKPSDAPFRYGVVKTDNSGRVRGFLEKPQNAAKGSLVNLGTYVVDRKALDLAPANRFFDFSRDLFPLLIRKGLLSAYRHDGYWSDLGDIKSYYEANGKFRGGFFYPLPIKEEMKKAGSSVVSGNSLVLGEAEESVVCGGSVVNAGARVNRCVVLGGEVFGVHYKRIIKNGIIVDV